ncbi:UDP-N-acetylglucosamine 2-epimerase [Pseudomonas juntendi]|uniref:UDP-N-acetylglucosamine 2-epimerase n=1 Tax=Pseudomonas TaxID=286 RepID=UPI0034D68CAC
MKRKICVVTGTRAEFGLLRWLINDLQDDPQVELQIVATGMHLSTEFGMTFREIEQAGFAITEKVEILLSSDSAIGVSKSMGLGLISFAEVYERLGPDIVVVLGDRFEIFAASAAALIAGLPIAHIHGGETTEGAFDEAIRHSITKMSHLHFVGAEEYKRRVIQLGEDPNRVFLVGGLGIDAIKRIKLLSREELESSLEMQLGVKNLLITFHPTTLDRGVTSTAQMNELFMALSELPDTTFIFTLPNADTGGRELADMVRSYSEGRPNVHVYSSLGQLRYLSCMSFVDGVVGNSSSGLAEAPSFNIGTVNIGDRQKGRLAAKSVIHCLPQKDDILNAIKKLYSDEFRLELNSSINPYGEGGASKKIAKILTNYDLDGILKKRFHDL